MISDEDSYRLVLARGSKIYLLAWEARVYSLFRCSTEVDNVPCKVHKN